MEAGLIVAVALTEAHLLGNGFIVLLLQMTQAKAA